jgi:ABC-type nitrate/sulfonate/bicarbonate transport system substrate-binding protein
MNKSKSKRSLYGFGGGASAIGPGIFAMILFSAQVSAQELKKVRMGYPAFSMTFLSFFVAKDAGLFKKYGLDVELIQMAGVVQTSALMAGEIDYLTGITTPLVAAARGLPLKGIMVTVRRPLFYVISSPDIQRMEDLAGKKLAVDRFGTLQHLIARLLFKKKGVNPDSITYIQTDSVSNSVLALSQGSVNAALLSLPNNVTMTQKGFRALVSAEELETHFPSGGLAVQEVKLKKDPAQVRSVLRAMLDSVEFSNKERSWIVNHIQQKWRLNQKAAEESYQLWISSLATDGKLSIKDLQEGLDLAYRNKQIPIPVDARTGMDYSLLDEVWKERKR